MWAAGGVEWSYSEAKIVERVVIQRNIIHIDGLSGMGQSLMVYRLRKTG